MSAAAPTGSLRACGRSFRWGGGAGPVLMAVINATPDSFSDGGEFLALGAAVAHGERCAAEGAEVLDVGGESTRPGAARVPAAEQVARTEGIVRALSARHAVSIDTTRAEVAAAAFRAGACMVNDVSGATEDPAMAEAVARAGASIVLMHRRFAPGDDRWSTEADPRRPAGDVVEEVTEWLAARVESVCRAGVPADSVAVDPGLGFGKDVEQNLRLLGGIGVVCRIGVPVLVGASRKSFLGAVSREPDPARRDAVSVAAALAAASRGAAFLRVHAVAPHAAALGRWRAEGRPGMPVPGG